jgi:hypothetical protein
MKPVVRGLVFGLLLGVLAVASGAQVTDTNVYFPPNYSTFQPPSAGGRYADPIFGTSIQRVTNAPSTQNLDAGGNLIFITDEYSSMAPFNLDNSKILLVQQSYFGLYDGNGNYLNALPMEINASSEPRWSRTNPNVLYYHSGNQLKTYDVSLNLTSVAHTFGEYSTVSGKGESDISFDGDHLVLAGDDRYVFVYEISTGRKGPVFDTGGRGFDSLYITPDNNVTITWLQPGTGRYNGIEMFDRNMSFLRQLTHAGGHMDVTRDNGTEVLVWTNSGDPLPLTGCNNGIVKIRLSDAQQTCLLSLDWSLAVHISGPDNSGYVLIETYAPSNPDPGSANWVRYTNEVLQIKLDGTEVRRLAHHRSRPFDSYNYTPRVSVSHDGTRLLYNSNYDLQAILGYPTDYADVYLAMIDAASSPTNNNPPGDGSGTTATTRTEETAPSISYTGTWFPNSSTVNSGGGAVLAVDAGSKATFTFTGTAVRWIGYRDEWSGIANVYLDGQFQAAIDTYASPAQAQQLLYSASGLSANSHTFVIEVTGTHGGSSGGAWVWVDAFDVDNTTSSGGGTPPPSSGGHYEQDASAVKYAGTWFTRSGSVFSGGTAALAMDRHASATFSFSGTGASWIGYKDAWSGLASVSVDGAQAVKIDTYSPTDLAQPVVYSISGLSPGNHVLKIDVLQRKSAASGGMWVWVDAFEAKP